MANISPGDMHGMEHAELNTHRSRTFDHFDQIDSDLDITDFATLRTALQEID